ncbi:glycosyltransferase family 4 protein [Chloroflexota bacterium]
MRILQEAYEVRECHFKGVKDVPTLLNGVWWADVTFSWFGALHALYAVLFSKLLGKKSVVVSGGYDVARVPEIGYGLFASWWKKYCPLFVFRYADLILCVSEANRWETLCNAKADLGKVTLVYHGFDDATFRRMPGVGKKNIVLTIGAVERDNLSRKGLELFVRSATFLPEKQFFLVGRWGDRAIDRLRRIAAPNVTFTGELSQEEVVRICSRAKVYVQASMHEAFSCSLAEAMLCECVPVVSRLGALPEVVGDCGLYIDNLEPKELAEKIEEASHSDMSKRARERIITLFPIEKRRAELFQAIDQLTKGVVHH